MSNANIDLSCEFCGITFPNPFLLASAPPTDTGEKIKRAFSMGWGGAVTKTLKPDDLNVKNASPRFAVLKGKNGETIGFENFELVDTRPLKSWIEEIKEIKSEFPDRILIGSIMAPCEKSAWQKLSIEIQNAGADALELNFSCPHGMPEKGVGHAIGQNPEITKEITSWVKEVSSVPVIVKLSPNVTNITTIAQAALEGGADALAAINTVQALIGIDIDTFEPAPAVESHTTYGGYSGIAIKPIGLRAVSEISKNTSAQISGMGGISTWQNAVEYMLVGANHVQICTEVMINGFHIIEGMISGLENYLKAKNMTSVRELIGLSLPKITSHEELDKTSNPSVSVDRSLCVNCARCVTACNDSGRGALSMELGERLAVDSNVCDGCSLCTHVCPFNALSL